MHERWFGRACALGLVALTGCGPTAPPVDVKEATATTSWQREHDGQAYLLADPRNDAIGDGDFVGIALGLRGEREVNGADLVLSGSRLVYAALPYAEPSATWYHVGSFQPLQEPFVGGGTVKITWLPSIRAQYTFPRGAGFISAAIYAFELNDVAKAPTRPTDLLRMAVPSPTPFVMEVTPEPTPEASPTPTPRPTRRPSASPSVKPSSVPSVAPSLAPSTAPSPSPT